MRKFAIIDLLQKICEIADYNQEDLELKCNALLSSEPFCEDDFYLCQEWNMLKNPSAFPDGNIGKMVELKIVKFMNLKNEDTLILWHRNFWKKFVLQQKIRNLKKTSFSLMDVFLFVSSMYLLHGTDKKQVGMAKIVGNYAPKKNKLFDIGILHDIYETSKNAPDVVKKTAQFLKAQSANEETEFYQWIISYLPVSGAGKDLHNDVRTGCVLRKFAAQKCGLTKWLMMFDLQQRQKRKIDVYDILNWLYYYCSILGMNSQEFEIALIESMGKTTKKERH